MHGNQQPFALLHNFIVVQECACSLKKTPRHCMPVSAGWFFQAHSSPLHSKRAHAADEKILVPLLNAWKD